MSWRQNPVGISAVLIPPPCKKSYARCWGCMYCKNYGPPIIGIGSATPPSPPPPPPPGTATAVPLSISATTRYTIAAAATGTATTRYTNAAAAGNTSRNINKYSRNSGTCTSNSTVSCNT